MSNSSYCSLESARKVEVDEDNVDLPVVSSGDTITISYTINGVKSGRLMLVLSSSMCVMSYPIWFCGILVRVMVVYNILLQGLRMMSQIEVALYPKTSEPLYD